MKKMIISFLIAGILSLGLAGLSFAAVVLYEEGTQVGTVEKVNVVGTSLTATASGKTGTITATAAPAITGGTINGAVIGGTSPAAATFTTVGTTGTITVGTPTIGGASPTKSVAVQGNLEVDGSIYLDGVVEASGVVNANSNVFADGSIYLTTAAPAAGGGVGLWLSQPDGGCSKCYVDAAGTTFACADATCPSGM